MAIFSITNNLFNTDAGDSNYDIDGLQGSDLENLNALDVYGHGLFDSQFIFPKVGGYWELINNESDTFQNFANGVYIGNPDIGSSIGGIKSMKINNSGDYFQLPTDEVSGLPVEALIGKYGDADFQLSGWVYKTQSNHVEIFSLGNKSILSSLEIYSTAENDVSLKVIKGNDTHVITGGKGQFTPNKWNKIIVERINNIVSVYLNNVVNPIISQSMVTYPMENQYEVRFGATLDFTETTTPPGMDENKTSPTYSISGSTNRVLTKISSGYQTARSNSVLKTGTGNYYFEVTINNQSGVQWVGVSETWRSYTETMGLSSWCISSNSRTFNHQSGGGTNWGGGNNGFSQGDVIGVKIDTDNGTAAFYKNGVLLGQPFDDINEDVEVMLAADNGSVLTINGEVNSPLGKNLPSVKTFTNPTHKSTPNTYYANCYGVGSQPKLSTINRDKLINKPTPIAVFRNTKTFEEYEVQPEWVLAMSDETISFTVPPYIPLSEDYELFLKSGIDETKAFPVTVSEVDVQLTPFEDDFSDPSTLYKNYYLMHRAWGGANGGVIRENSFIRDGELILRAHGDNYNGSLQGADRVGDPKFHTDPLDPKVGSPWTTRVGGCVEFNKKTGFGRYELECYIPDQLGVASAMWTFFYNEIYPDDPRYPEYQSENLHPQGNAVDGYYTVRNHEIDIEFPSHLDGGVLSDPSLSNMKCNTWRGELQNWSVPRTDPSYWEEYRDNLTPVGFSIADGQYHNLRFDWYHDRVEFYIDDVLKQTNVNTSDGDTIPDIPGHFVFGLWFPSSALPAKPWLANPDKAWAGGVLDSDGGMKADFDTVEMRVRKFKFTPFASESSFQRITAETYPFLKYRLYTPEI